MNSSLLYVLIFIAYFVVTVILEYLVYAIAIRKDFLKLLKYVVLVNAFTWPLVNLITGVGFLWAELGVFAVEFVLIMFLLRIKWGKALIISFIANLITALVGAILSLLVY